MVGELRFQVPCGMAKKKKKIIVSWEDKTYTELEIYSSQAMSAGSSMTSGQSAEGEGDSFDWGVRKGIIWGRTEAVVGGFRWNSAKEQRNEAPLVGISL